MIAISSINMFIIMYSVARLLRWIITQKGRWQPFALAVKTLVKAGAVAH